MFNKCSLKFRRKKRKTEQPSFENSNIDSDYDEDFQGPPSFAKGRRASVSAEPLNMEDDISNDRVIHPKSDEQRKRLQGAVMDILMFRSLDQETREYVLDAMFEKPAPKDEKVIELGDDGDFFYVVEFS